jgi:hypothetical protein
VHRIGILAFQQVRESFCDAILPSHRSPSLITIAMLTNHHHENEILMTSAEENPPSPTVKVKHRKEDGNFDDAFGEFNRLGSSSDTCDGIGREETASDTNTTSELFHWTLFVDQMLFFLAGLGSSMGYISSLSSLVYFQQRFGNNFFVVLNLAVYLPLVPISVAQALWDQQYDQYFATDRAFLFRGIIGYVFVLSGTIGMIFAMTGESQYHHHLNSMWAVAYAFVQGVGGAILYGQLNQLASFVNKTGRSDISGTSNLGGANGDSLLPRKFKTAVSAGVQASALVVLLMSWTSGFGTMNGARFSIFLWMVVGAVSLCFLSMLSLLTMRPQARASMIHRDSSIRTSIRRPVSSPNPSPLRLLGEEEKDGSRINLQQPLLSQRQPRQGGLELIHDSPTSSTSLLASPPNNRREEEMHRPLPADNQTVELSFAELWQCSRRCCFILALTLIPSFLVGSWFTRVHSKWMELPQVLFYVRIAMDFVGRLATLCHFGKAGNQGRLSSTCDDGHDDMSWVIWTAIGRWIVVVLFFVNSSFSIDVGAFENYRDTISITLVAIIAFLSGYLVTTCYQLAPQQLPLDSRTTMAPKQASFLTVAFAFSALGGQGSSFLLIAIGV